MLISQILGKAAATERNIYLTCITFNKSFTADAKKGVKQDIEINALSAQKMLQLFASYRKFL